MKILYLIQTRTILSRNIGAASVPVTNSTRLLSGTDNGNLRRWRAKSSSNP
jgi:hypothetical protein